jgi:membrane protein
MADRLRLGMPWIFVSALLASGFAMRTVRTLHPAPARSAQKGAGDVAAAYADEAMPRPVDIRRAHQVGRGRAADSPFDIPWNGWRDIFWRVYASVDEDRLLAVSGGVVFFGLLAMFPTITAFVSIYGLFATPAGVRDELVPLFSIMPGDAANLVVGEVQRIAAKSSNTLGLASIGSLLFALWSANAGSKAIFDALNVAYGEKEKRGFIKLNLISFAFTIGAILFLLLAVAAVIVVPLILGNIGFLDWGETILSALRWPILFVLIAGALSLLYRYGPSRTLAKWRWLTLGSAVATVLFLVVSGLFSWYLANFANYNATYGSLGALVGLLMWLWVSILVVLAGAELDAEIEHQTARDSTVGPAKPLGSRGAMMADTVGVEEQS